MHFENFAGWLGEILLYANEFYDNLQHALKCSLLVDVDHRLQVPSLIQGQDLV